MIEAKYMKNLIVKLSKAADQVFAAYPTHVKDKMLKLREMVISVAQELDEIKKLNIELKWGEPSFITSIGSTLRMDWKPKTPDQYAMYFQCNSRLVNTFKTVYGDLFTYEGNRAILFKLNDELPEEQLRECIKAALTYHKVKDLLTLGL